MERTGRRHGLEGSWDWLEYAAGLPSKPINVAGTSANFLVASGRSILTGLSLINAATTAGTVKVHDGTDTTGMIIYANSIAGSGILNASLPVRGLLVEIGIFVEVLTATLNGAVYITPLWHYPHTAPGE